MSIIIEEQDSDPSNPHRRKILKSMPIGRTQNGYWCDLSCGHHVAVFGDVEQADGYVVCDRCREEAKKKEQ